MPVLSHESIAKRGLEGCKMIDGLACCKSCLLTPMAIVSHCLELYTSLFESCSVHRQLASCHSA